MTSTLLPFLYNTRTILRVNPRIPLTFSRSLHATRRQLKEGDEIPFASYVPRDVDTPPEQPHRRGTITPSERRIFERIFSDIKARGLKPFVPETSGTRTTLSIMQQAVQDASQIRPAAVDAPGLSDSSTQTRDKALLRFPAELRAAASKAFDTMQPSDSRRAADSRRADDDDIAYDEASIAASRGDPDDDEGWKVPSHILERAAELEAKRYPERTRIEGLITAAETDFELWDVLEKEVFSMPARLGFRGYASKLVEAETEAAKNKTETVTDSEIVDDAEDMAAAEGVAAAEDVAADEDVAAALESADAPKITPEETDVTSTENDTPSQELNLYVHGPLYPEYLLLALRRLDTAFRTPSILAFSMLPRIKELGLESYILGVSTPFYNELLEIYWIRRCDLSGVLNLLEEMRNCGLQFDAQTVSFLGRVNTALTMLATREAPSSFARALMSLPEYNRSVRHRIRHWHEAVEASVNEDMVA
ncbi:hypothetical protein F5Y00DRAFT_246450 [Daldinia vernicosa]|uniref:uncharacterized protein n=1 Tax=Daldinia vernicosa TaxID=114800 RepID=UPI002007D99F|nr:uncharacterized protein F5Y00DRAFT_246450 [Daldinia vernicosa]KAI0845383.1 hypothetical protein F5Y00DRAFT_246450 [Daldinia vernicosa]